MSAWSEWMIAEKNGDAEWASIARKAYEDECRIESLEERDMYLEACEDDDEM